MANRIAQVVVTFSDISGKLKVSKMNFQATVVGDELSYDTLVASVKAVLDEIETFTKLKYVKCQAIIPLSITVTGAKANPVAGSSVFNQGILQFKSAPGDAGRSGKSQIWVASPPTTVLSANHTTFDTANADVTALRDAVLANVNTKDGRALASLGDTAIRIRRTRK